MSRRNPLAVALDLALIVGALAVTTLGLFGRLDWLLDLGDALSSWGR